MFFFPGEFYRTWFTITTPNHNAPRCLRRWQRSILVTQPTHPALIEDIGVKGEGFRLQIVASKADWSLEWLVVVLRYVLECSTRIPAVSWSNLTSIFFKWDGSKPPTRSCLSFFLLERDVFLRDFFLQQSDQANEVSRLWVIYLLWMKLVVLIGCFYCVLLAIVEMVSAIRKTLNILDILVYSCIYI